MIAARMATLRPGKPANLPDKPPTQTEAAELLGASERSVRSARRVLDSDDKQLIARVESGDTEVSKAASRLPIFAARYAPALPGRSSL
jgi:hypothetical protein